MFMMSMFVFWVGDRNHGYNNPFILLTTSSFLFVLIEPSCGIEGKGNLRTNARCKALPQEISNHKGGQCSV